MSFRYAAPRLLVITTTVLQKSTTWPWPGMLGETLYRTTHRHTVWRRRPQLWRRADGIRVADTLQHCPMTMGELYPPFRVLSSDPSLPPVVWPLRWHHALHLPSRRIQTPCVSWVFLRCIYLVGTSSS